LSDGGGENEKGAGSTFWVCYRMAERAQSGGMAEEEDRSCGQQQHLHFPLWGRGLGSGYCRGPALSLFPRARSGASQLTCHLTPEWHGGRHRSESEACPDVIAKLSHAMFTTTLVQGPNMVLSSSTVRPALARPLGTLRLACCPA
jgi:hypothetical protein